MESPLVTLTTDWGYRDFFQGMVKGKLYSALPGLRIVDITHGIEPYKVGKAIFVVKNACLSFPPSTIHIIDIQASQTPEEPFVVVRYHDQYYITIDNGLPKAVFGDEWDEAVIIDKVWNDTPFYTFATADLFYKVVIMLANGEPLSAIGPSVDKLKGYTPFTPILNGNRLKTSVAYVDSYGNAILNLTYEEFERIRGGRSFRMMVREMILSSVVPSYLDYDTKNHNRAHLVLTVSATGYLQVALSRGSVEQHVGLEEDYTVDIDFYNS